MAYWEELTNHAVTLKVDIIRPVQFLSYTEKSKKRRSNGAVLCIKLK